MWRLAAPSEVEAAEHGLIVLWHKRAWTRTQSMSALLRFSDINLFGNCKRVVHLDP